MNWIMVNGLSIMVCGTLLGAVPAGAYSGPSQLFSAAERQGDGTSGVNLKVPELTVGLGDRQSTGQFEKTFILAQESVPYFFWDRTTDQKAPTLEMGRSSAGATNGQFCKTAIKRCELEQPAPLNSDCSCRGSHSNPHGYVTP